MPSATLRDDLYLEYLFCPGSGQVVPDTSGNARHGLLGASLDADTDDPSWVSNGVYLDNPGYFENPDQFITGVGVPMTLDESEFYASYYEISGLTFEVWIKPDEITALGNFRTLMSITGQELILKKISGEWYTNFVSWYASDNAGFIPGGYTKYPAPSVSTATTPIPEDEWSHIVIVRNGAGVSHYLNGALIFERQLSPFEFFDAFNTEPGEILADDGEASPGMFLGGILGGSPSFPGRIGEARVYTVALSAEQVLSNYTLSNYYPDGKNVCGGGGRNRYYAF